MVLNQNNTNFIKEILEELEKNNLYRDIKTFDIQKDSTLKYKKYNINNFSSNDYLGLSKNKKILKQLNKLIQLSNIINVVHD